jgi:hypothetical protein
MRRSCHLTVEGTIACAASPSSLNFQVQGSVTSAVVIPRGYSQAVTHKIWCHGQHIGKMAFEVRSNKLQDSWDLQSPEPVLSFVWRKQRGGERYQGWGER